MSDYIKREDALNFPFANGIYDHDHANEHFINGCETYREWLGQLPSADVVERKKGQWIGEADGYADGELVYDTWYCSCCDYVAEDEERPMWKFCPNCGAEMREANND